jgi:hypothetical protein
MCRQAEDPDTVYSKRFYAELSREDRLVTDNERSGRKWQMDTVCVFLTDAFFSALGATLSNVSVGQGCERLTSDLRSRWQMCEGLTDAQI